MFGPFGVGKAKLGESRQPIWQGLPIELSLEAIEKGVEPGEKPGSAVTGEPRVGDGEQRAAGVRCQRVPKNGALPFWHFGSRRDVPFVLEEPRRIPSQDPSARTVLGWARDQID